jgi:hypothetical protein
MIRLFDLASGIEQAQIPLGKEDQYVGSPYSPAFSLAFSPNGNTLACGFADRAFVSRNSVCLAAKVSVSISSCHRKSRRAFSFALGCCASRSRITGSSAERINSATNSGDEHGIVLADLPRIISIR